MTFSEYWEKNHDPFGSNPEQVAELAWNAAIGQSAQIAYSYGTASGLPGSTARIIGHQICAGATKPLTQHAVASVPEVAARWLNQGKEDE